MPPVRRRDGHERRVGIEIELAGVTAQACAEALVEHFGGELRVVHEHEVYVDAPLGEFRVELDSRPLKEMSAEIRDAPTDDAPSMRELRNRIALGIAEPFVPIEIITPPLPFDGFDALDDVLRTLRERGAKGTSDRIFYAFGVHFNPEVPSLRGESILAHMRAFFLLRDWIRKDTETDILRRVFPHIEPHPDVLVDRLMDPGYGPDRDQLIDDYLELSPSRNHDLDMLPLFAFLAEDRVRAVVGPEEKINPRPTYHYRLPNSQVGDPRWRLSDEWRSWLLVERLAHDPERLRSWIRAWHDHRASVVVDLFRPWADEVEERITS